MYILYFIFDAWLFLSFRYRHRKMQFRKMTWRQHRAYEVRTRLVRARIAAEQRDLEAFNSRMRRLDEQAINELLL